MVQTRVKIHITHLALPYKIEFDVELVDYEFDNKREVKILDGNSEGELLALLSEMQKNRLLRVLADMKAVATEIIELP